MMRQMLSSMGVNCMIVIRHIACFLVWFILVFSGLRAQHFVSIVDASGVALSGTDRNRLENAVQDVRNVLPSNDRERFKVYDIGFYLHHEKTNVGIDYFWDRALYQIVTSGASDYYVVFGRESSDQGVNNHIRVAINLPTNSAFDCLTNEERNQLAKYVEAAANKNLHLGYATAEVEALNFLEEFLFQVIHCGCSTNHPDCSRLSEFKFLDVKLISLGFRKIETTVTSGSGWSSGNQGIFDYADLTITINGNPFSVGEEIAEGKAFLEASSQVLEEGTYSTSLSGEVYILDNESFSNGEWETALERGDAVDYVEYWVILKEKDDKYFLYSRFTLGALTTVSALTNPGDPELAASVILSPWGAALKALGNAALDAVIQATIIRFTDHSVEDWSQAWDKVSYLGAAWEGISSLIPWKKDYKYGLFRAACGAFAVVLDNALRREDYTVEDGVKDFIVGFAASGIVTLTGHPKVVAVGKAIYRKGLGIWYSKFPDGPNVVKKVINAALERVGGKAKEAIETGVNKVDNSISAETAEGLTDNLDEIELVSSGNNVNLARKFWMSHEENVSMYLMGLGKMFGTQLTFEVQLLDGTKFRVRFDNLIMDENGFYTICDSKSSIIHNLGSELIDNIIRAFSTKNQKKLYMALKGETSPVSKILPKGPRALGFLGETMDIADKLNKEILFYVNDHAYQGYNIFLKKFKF